MTTLNNIVLSGILDLVGTFFPPAAPLTGTIAASYVTAIGLTYASVFENLVKVNIHGDGKEAVENFLKENFKKEFARHASKSIPSREALAVIGESFIEE
ncbi:hypothetical protein F7734_17540 [Scytonema sp. UIC 10036]|uniref:hypothetical protein n=1 Tax=Scytonema sp. UIC 10036 TaxID=2304196 RepID=UPI0012DA1926|nr:hypothetical protein [Scytonema sp. UIC 10036]MUG94096.1 hypothetical protein [Scytonema sp. UIC 10036]